MGFLLFSTHYQIHLVELDSASQFYHCIHIIDKMITKIILTSTSKTSVGKVCFAQNFTYYADITLLYSMLLPSYYAPNHAGIIGLSLEMELNAMRNGMHIQ